MSELQRQDMVDLGTLILALACRHPVTASSRGDSLAFMAQHYSPELHNLAASLVSKPPTVFEVRWDVLWMTDVCCILRYLYTHANSVKLCGILGKTPRPHGSLRGELIAPAEGGGS